MYQLIYDNKEGTQIFYDKKNQKLARLNLNISSSNDRTVKSNFGLISLAAALLSNSIIGKLILNEGSNPLQLLLIVYLLAIFSGITLFIIMKKNQSRILDKNQIEFSEEEVARLMIDSTDTINKGIVKVSIVFIGLGVFSSIVFLLTHILLLTIFTWLFIFSSVFFICEPTIYHVSYITKNEW
ncbi:hypothetical protein [Enterococcus sp. AZ109]|uniref:hypothetical protein n=1 Tax=Enterococcus sp. AZ109 TaxID=2774634 RepID=UPI003F22D66B